MHAFVSVSIVDVSKSCASFFSFFLVRRTLFLEITVPLVGALFVCLCASISQEPSPAYIHPASCLLFPPREGNIFFTCDGLIDWLANNREEEQRRPERFRRTTRCLVLSHESCCCGNFYDVCALSSFDSMPLLVWGKPGFLCYI